MLNINLNTPKNGAGLKRISPSGAVFEVVSRTAISTSKGGETTAVQVYTFEHGDEVAVELVEKTLIMFPKKDITKIADIASADPAMVSKWINSADMDLNTLRRVKHSIGIGDVKTLTDGKSDNSNKQNEILSLCVANEGFSEAFTQQYKAYADKSRQNQLDILVSLLNGFTPEELEASRARLGL